MARLAIPALLAMLCSCVATQNDLIEQHPEWSAEDVAAIKRLEVKIGFTLDQVQASWGFPKSVQTHEGENSQSITKFYEYERNAISAFFRHCPAGRWMLHFEPRRGEFRVVSKSNW